MKKLLISSAVAIALANAQAKAADLALPPPVPIPVYTWTGCYVGAEGGYAWGISDAKTNGTTLNPTASILTPVPAPLLIVATGFSTNNITGNYRVSGGIAGGTAGCNLWQWGNWLLGAEADLSWTNKTGSGLDQPPFGVGGPPTNNTTTEQWLNTDRVRIGYVVNNNWLVYATGGFALAQVQYTISGAAITGGSVSETHTPGGWTVGAGVEWAFAGGWSAKAEYLYVNFGSTPYFNFPGAIPAVTGVVANRSGGVFLDDNIVRVGVNYRFNAATLFGRP